MYLTHLYMPKSSNGYKMETQDEVTSPSPVQKLDGQQRKEDY